jgi:rare lipoprotein A
MIKNLLLSLVLMTVFLFPLHSGVYETGIASWYAGEFQGELTANGEIFDTNEISAAHKTLPFGTIVRVTNMENGRHVDVRINDRGPYVEGRIIDLSKAAAEEIDILQQGIAPVSLEILHSPDTPESAYRRIEDAQYLSFQLGAFSSVARTLSHYIRLREEGFTPSVTLTGNRLLRLRITSVPSGQKEEVEQRLSTLGFTEVLIQSDQ